MAQLWRVWQAWDSRILEMCQKRLSQTPLSGEIDSTRKEINKNTQKKDVKGIWEWTALNNVVSQKYPALFLLQGPWKRVNQAGLRRKKLSTLQISTKVTFQFCQHDGDRNLGEANGSWNWCKICGTSFQLEAQFYWFCFLPHSVGKGLGSLVFNVWKRTHFQI